MKNLTQIEIDKHVEKLLFRYISCVGIKNATKILKLAYKKAKAVKNEKQLF